MIDILLAQIGLKKDDVAALGQRVMKGVSDIERRLERIERALEITDPLEPGPYDAPENEGINGDGE